MLCILFLFLSRDFAESDINVLIALITHDGKKENIYNELGVNYRPNKSKLDDKT